MDVTLRLPTRGGACRPEPSSAPPIGSCRRRSPMPAGTLRAAQVRVILDDRPDPSRLGPEPAWDARCAGHRYRGRLWPGVPGTRGGWGPPQGRPSARRRLQGRGGAADMTIRVLLVDDEELVRFGLGPSWTQPWTSRSSARPPTVCRPARPRPAAPRRRPDGHPDAPHGRPGSDPAHPRAAPTAAVAILTTFHLDEYVFPALEAGAGGFLLKDTPPREILAAVRAVAAGTEMLSPAVTASSSPTTSPAAHAPRRRGPAQRLTVLSDRELEVMELLGRGMSNAEQADAVRQRGHRQDLCLAAAHQARHHQPHPGGDPRTRGRPAGRLTSGRLGP